MRGRRFRQSGGPAELDHNYNDEAQLHTHFAEDGLEPKAFNIRYSSRLTVFVNGVFSLEVHALNPKFGVDGERDRLRDALT